MFSAIYLEKEIEQHPRSLAVMEKFPQLPRIPVQRYGEIFNRAQQNFRLQKSTPPLLLAKKHGRWVLPAPADYSIGGQYNYYFSHMMNCIYDCRYCFLQGMYRSAANVLFVNFEDMLDALYQTLTLHPDDRVYFFSGYDCDSLAMDPVSGFVDAILPFFAEHPRAILELRSKSTQIRSLLNHQAMPNCVVAFSLSPQTIVEHYEAKTPALEKRLQALVKLQQAGWPIGLRFDPVILCKDFEKQYADLFQRVFSRIDASRLHSVSLGSFRLPQHFFKRLRSLYPDSSLFAAPFSLAEDNMVGYVPELIDRAHAFCEKSILEYIAPDIYFPCYGLRD